ncbi:MAG: hypothetical protein FWD96_04665, partial [Defluviitaleaceae bacterium]|nr:hypothetical protein [Defluviitaleaceae bacterium]
MKNFIEDLMTKGNMKAANIAIAILFGIGLIVMANVWPDSSAPQEDYVQYVPQAEGSAIGPQPRTLTGGVERPSQGSHEEMLERRLEGILRTVHGVGNVRVMITLAAGTHRVYAENVTRSEATVTETDSAGGRRDQRDISGQQT